jgi:type II secretory pathway pseudopilin PulG
MITRRSYAPLYGFGQLDVGRAVAAAAAASSALAEAQAAKAKARLEQIQQALLLLDMRARARAKADAAANSDIVRDPSRMPAHEDGGDGQGDEPADQPGLDDAATETDATAWDDALGEVMVAETVAIEGGGEVERRVLDSGLAGQSGDPAETEVAAAADADDGTLALEEEEEDVAMAEAEPHRGSLADAASFASHKDDEPLHAWERASESVTAGVDSEQHAMIAEAAEAAMAEAAEPERP